MLILHWLLGSLAYLIMCGTETLEFSSNTLVIRPLQRMLSMHWNEEQRNFIAWERGRPSGQAQVPRNHRPHLADVAGPRCLFLAGRSQEHDGEGRTVRRLHHDLELQVVEALAGGVVWGRGRGRRVCSTLWKQLWGLSGRECAAAHSPRRWRPAPRSECTRSGTAFPLAAGSGKERKSGMFYLQHYSRLESFSTLPEQRDLKLLYLYFFLLCMNSVKSVV